MPEYSKLGLEETRTAGVVADRLEQMGLMVKRDVGRTGVMGLFGGNR